MSGDKTIPLVEMFGPTVQGEGAVIGAQTYFLRFGLCDMKCKMCDSMHAVDPLQVKARASWLTQDEIFERLTDFREPNSAKMVTFSGGNPCIHDLNHLADLLNQNGWTIAVETQGTFSPTWLSKCHYITVSPKGPGMGETCDLDKLDAFFKAFWRNRDIGQQYLVSIKVVVFDQRDLDFARALYERYFIEQQLPIEFFLSLGNPFPPGPATQNISHLSQHVPMLIEQYQVLFSQIKNDRSLSQMRFLPQWHVFVWGNAQGR